MHSVRVQCEDAWCGVQYEGAQCGDARCEVQSINRGRNVSRGTRQLAMLHLQSGERQYINQQNQE